MISTDKGVIKTPYKLYNAYPRELDEWDTAPGASATNNYRELGFGFFLSPSPSSFWSDEGICHTPYQGLPVIVAKDCAWQNWSPADFNAEAVDIPILAKSIYCIRINPERN